MHLARTASAFAIIMIVWLLCSCVTTGFIAEPPITPRKVDLNFRSVAETDEISATIVIHNETDATIKIVNNSDKPIIIDWDSFAYMRPSGESVRLIHAGVRLVDRDKPQARQTIPAGGNITDSLVAANAVYSGSGSTWGTLSWITIPPAGASFTLAYYWNNELRFLECKNFEDHSDYSQIKIIERLGTISTKLTYWHLFFIASPENERTELLALAEKKKQQEYGESAKLSNIRYYSGWNVASLLLYFSMLGWVEDASITADAIKQSEK